MGKWIEGTVVAQKAWREGLYSLQVEADIGAFQAGQYAKIAAPVAGKLVARPFSFVNAPRETPHEFYYNLVPGGPLSQRLARLEPMDVVFLAPSASGAFVLSEIPEGDNLWLMATGTGLGPFLSMLKTEIPWKRYKEVVLVHAVRHAADLAYRSTIESFRARYPAQLRVVSLVSREHYPEALSGRIPQAIEGEQLERAAGVELSARASQVMLCGNPDMVADTTEVLKGRGMRRHRRREPGHIAAEPYW